MISRTYLLKGRRSMVESVGGKNSSAILAKGMAVGQLEKTTDRKFHNYEGDKSQGQLKTITKEQMDKIVSAMNDFLQAAPHTHLKFEFHDQLNEYYITIVDEVTKEIVKEIPPRKMLDMFAAMTEFVGLMVDKKI